MAQRGGSTGHGAKGKIQAVIPYAPRPQFVAFHGRQQRFALGVAHRRAGKTVACINDLIRGALTCSRPKPRFAYIAPLFKMAKSIAWDYLKHYALAVPGTTAHEAELRVDLPRGGQVRLHGADNPDALRGIYLDGVVLDEYAQMRPQVWPEVIRPALADRLGWAAFIGSPMGRNAFCELYETAKADPSWFVFRLKASETGLIPQDELDAARAAMSGDQYAQEFGCALPLSYGAAEAAHHMPRRRAGASDPSGRRPAQFSRVRGRSIAAIEPVIALQGFLHGSRTGRHRLAPVGRHQIERTRRAERRIAIAAIRPPDAGPMHLHLAEDKPLIGR
jgi:hypothetical protein